MSDNEKDLLRIVRDSDDPGQAAITAIKVFATFLERLGASPEPPAGDPRESA